MKILVKVKTRAKKVTVEKLEQPSLGFETQEIETPVYKVSVKEPAESGRANRVVAKALAEYLKVPISSITLVSGQTYTQKIFEIK